MNQSIVFLSYVRQTLKTWIGFQQAIHNGMGGVYAKEKESWLGTEIEKYFITYDDVEPDDLENYIAEMIENEFDTVFEDGSLSEVSRNFCRAYALSLTNPSHEMFLKMEQKASEIEEEVPMLVEDEELAEDGERINELEAADECMEQLMVNEANAEKNDGWTTVTKKNRKAK